MEQILIQNILSINLGIWILVAIQIIKIIYKIIRYMLFRLEIQMIETISNMNIEE